MAAIDLTVTSVEVTQATQTPTNSVQLVAQRSTAVRATIGVSGSGGAPVAGVTGRLHVFRNGVEVTPAAGVAPINAPFTAPVAPTRANQNHTLNFELAAPTGIAASTDVDFRVDVTPVPGEASTANNSGAASNLTVVNGTTPSLFFTRINYTPSGLGLPSDAFISPGVGDAFVRGILPVNDGDANLYRQGLFPSLTYSEDANGDGKLETDPSIASDGVDLLSLLASCRQLIVDNGLGATDSTFLYGWLAGNPINGNGQGQMPGRNAYGNSAPVRGQRSYAHELTHNFGFDHITSAIDQVGWDVGARLSGNPATNNTAGRVKPTSLFDIQVAGLLTNQAWIDSAKYAALLSNPALGFGAGSPDRGGDARKQASRRVLVIQGIFDPTGKRIRVLKPVFRYPWLSQPTQVNRAGRFLVQVQTATSVIKVPFDAAVRDDGKENDVLGLFEVMVPARGDVTSITITNREGRETYASIVRSKRPPQLRILAPASKGTLGRQTTVRFTASDPDTPTSSLMYQVAYSPDGGRTFVPVGVDVTATQLTFDSTQIQASRGRGLIRVFASDGLNTVYADVRGLSTEAASYPAP